MKYRETRNVGIKEQKNAKGGEPDERHQRTLFATVPSRTNAYAQAGLMVYFLTFR